MSLHITFGAVAEQTLDSLAARYRVISPVDPMYREAMNNVRIWFRSESGTIAQFKRRAAEMVATDKTNIQTTV